MPSVAVTAVGPPCTLGEAPLWDAETQVLYYVDIIGREIHRYNPKTKKDTFIKIEGGQPTFVIPINGENNKLLVSITLNLAVVTWDGESPTADSIQVIASVKEDKPGNRLNDGKAAPNGTLWAGTMGSEISPGVFPEDAGALYSFLNFKSPVKHLENVGVSNGLVWTRDMKKFYYIDTTTYRVDAFDMEASGNLSNRHTIINFREKDPGVRPDGLTIDGDGKLWVANVAGSEVLRVDPLSGTIIQKVSIPSNRVTCMVFGGPNLDELYVTTTTIRTTEEELKKWPQSGSTFVVTGLGVKGYAGDRVVLPL